MSVSIELSFQRFMTDNKKEKRYLKCQYRAQSAHIKEHKTGMMLSYFLLSFISGSSNSQAEGLLTTIFWHFDCRSQNVNAIH